MTDMAVRGTLEKRQHFLGALAKLLRVRGFGTEMCTTATGTPKLRVTNREARDKSVEVLCALGTDDALTFYWPAGGRIGYAHEVTNAMREVRRVLSSG